MGDTAKRLGLIAAVLGLQMIVVGRVEAGNIALNPSGTGNPSPLASDRGWGGGSFPWEIVDGLRSYTDTWAHGLAFTGGHTGGPGSGGWLEPAGVRQATITFAGLESFDKVIIWHHGEDHAPATAFLDYWDGSNWNSINFTRTYGTTTLPGPGSSTSDEYTFASVTGSKVRYSFDNRGNNVLGTPNVHGWIYEFEVFSPDTSAVPEPTAFTLFALGGIGMLLVRRCRTGRSSAGKAE